MDKAFVELLVTEFVCAEVVILTIDSTEMALADAGTFLGNGQPNADIFGGGKKRVALLQECAGVPSCNTVAQPV